MGKWLNKFKRANFQKLFKNRNDVLWGSVPKPGDINEMAKGRELIIDGLKSPVLVERAVGNNANPKMVEINGQHLISFLDFFTQLNEGRRPTEEEKLDWDSIELVQIDVPKQKKIKKEDLN